MLAFRTAASGAEIAVSTRDWKGIKTELDELRPGDAERQHAPATDQDAQPIQPRNTEDSILMHIADALRRDEVEHP
jgi:hypothetical protein